MNTTDIIELTKQLRYHILTMTTKAGSGHPTSSLSAVELIATLMYGGFFFYDLNAPEDEDNDRLIFSKGHASPLFYAAWAVARQKDGEEGKVVPDELSTYREFDSRLEGHPTFAFPYTEASTGSLGQGLSIGVGMALAARFYGRSYTTYVLLGDSETAEGSVWEAAAVASQYSLNNIVALLDANGLGQRGETMEGRDVQAHKEKWEAFGWEVTVIDDGNSVPQVREAFEALKTKESDRPAIIVAPTKKGAGISFLEDKDGWHGKTLSEEELQNALLELDEVDLSKRGDIEAPLTTRPASRSSTKVASGGVNDMSVYEEDTATREAYGRALTRLASSTPEMVVLDAEVSNSTRTDIFKEIHPERFFEMYIAEQNMVGTALGLSRRGMKPCVSTFAAFLTRAFDQIRMAQYSAFDGIIMGSHAGISIGYDGSSQMGLEDLALFRSVPSAVVLYPSDAVSMEVLVEKALEHTGIVYIRGTRAKTPILYSVTEARMCNIGSSSVLKESAEDVVTIVAAGITLHEALEAYAELYKEGVAVRVIDLYSIQPLDRETLIKAGKETGRIITVEDHYPAGGIGEAVSSALSDSGIPVTSLSVNKEPKSGSPQELLEYAGISAQRIQEEVKYYIR